ncbi:MAG: energy-coupling factor transporter ATPase [Armatimonadota bacterium]|nr:energy-coupling factor transporter ATPase [Armatimonadota bacterium]MDR7438590.1 energy-coupling factor transporter ATPase [Armatimonadota bacterium]MDR7562689.1 energy-coupling factor transporter ATPase [Armatimonadota bacterium]MDR7567646.1 energy-coupling factor transporter ATPase [Armatimonadota bacterium]MDR7601748.1 energy-coupling factor transporter ATPase [Armatimonadota bacterium]
MSGESLLACQDLTHVYLAGTPLASVALRGVSLAIHRGESVGLLGPTGSGKSTLVQIFAGLLRPTGGRVWVGGVDLWARGVNLKQIRQRIGLVFQYPEHQLFEQTVFEDVAFGPRNLGLGPEEVTERVEEALALVGLPPEAFRHRSPFSLSGGEMRRVAIAGVLAMRPEVLILDEPMAGLDPQGRRALLELIRKLRTDRPGLTVVLISHRMDDVARVCERVVVLHQGLVYLDAPVREAFREAVRLREIGLDVPRVTDVLLRLRAAGLPVRTDRLTVEEACAEIVQALRS